MKVKKSVKSYSVYVHIFIVFLYQNVEIYNLEKNNDTPVVQFWGGEIFLWPLALRHANKSDASRD